MKQLRQEELMRGIDEDDIEIHRYERILGYNKRKSKNMPKVFRIEGLDYLLEMCDSKSQQHSDVDGESCPDVYNNGMLSDESDEDSSKSKVESSASTTSILKKNLPGSPEIQQDGCSEMDENSEDEKDINMNSEEEDIYGRLINKKTGEFLPSKLCAKEKLNELEQKAGLLETEEHLKLKKSLRGLVNRLNEHTLVGAVKMFSDIFASRGHNEVKQLLFSEITNSVDVSYRLPDRLIIEYAVFIALIHTTVSAEVSAHFVENYILKLLETVAALPEGKSLENLCILLAELYNFKVIKVIVIIEIMQCLREQVNDKCLTCFKALLSYCGNTMKSRDSDALQKCIVETQSFFAQVPETSSKAHQLRYIVDEINAIKNINIRKFTDMIDFELYSHYVDIFRGLTKKMDKEKELPMSVDDIMHIGERGRWWLVGSAWFPTTSMSKNKTDDKLAGEPSKFSASLLQLAKKAKMNTAIRRDIFCTIMSSTNEMDAFEKLLRLSFKGQQEREIVHICVHCALREATYNAFYAAVIDRLCCYHKRFKLTTQYALWDRIKVLSQLNELQRENLTLLIADLMIKRSVGITVLKVIEFGAIDKITAQFVRSILSAVLIRSTQQGLMDMFQNVVNSPQHKFFVEGLQVFIHVALKKHQKNVDNKLLLSRIEFIESIWGNIPL
ncbi:nucleolar MIF4G domain-containing protein 1 [Loa loa]|uniref:Nucleolar MIF4G domain-containing protein 1 n=1 Tax=Loa loa TaxID=7209 RepID=A0A1S0UG26_LOALO|nr:nucleolar MIF4G domain-containing protein 1 [Loa loa]EJD74642.1 nucleolar MIF4G domain-containing protein 1 [Loa loa]